MKRTAIALLAGSSLVLSALGAQPAKAPAAGASQPAAVVPKPKPFDPVVLRVRSALESVAGGGDFAAAAATVSAMWDYTCCNVPVEQVEVFREVASAQRLMADLAAYTGDKAGMMKFLRASPRLRDALVFQIAGGEGDKPEAVLGVLDELRAKFPAAQLEELANLTAAICVVYDQPVVKHVNENQGVGVTAVEAFRYYSTFERQMVCSPRTMPVELLVFMVDAGASMEEYAWAQKRYSGQREVGPRYSEIQYDQDAFTNGTIKKLTKEGFNLWNIKKYGGICADQAHFASTVGKVIGVPAVVDSGRSSEVGHAWLGYLKFRGRSAEWNFDSGRYDQYEDIRGSVTDPQTGTTMPDGTLALSAEAMDVPDAARQASVAFSDAAARLGKINGTASAAGLEIAEKPAGRTAKADDRIELLRASLTLYSSNYRAWNVLRAMAKGRELSLDQKKEWAGTLQRLCGNKYPDFTVAVMIPMVETIDDVGQQGAIWDTLYKKMRPTRQDLASEVMIAQARMWDKAGKPEKAYECYTSAAYQFLNKSPASVDALESCEAMLKKRNAAGGAVDLYANAWRRLSKPEQMAQEFLTQSNWYRVGTLYSAALESSGQAAKAEQIRKALGEDEKSRQRREKDLQRRNNQGG